MSFFHRRPSWHLPESAATPEKIFINRRQLLRTLGLGSLALLGGTSLQHCSPVATTADSGLPDQTQTPTSRPVGKTNPNILPADPKIAKQNYDTDAPGLDLYPVSRNNLYSVTERKLTPEDPVQQYNNYYEFSTNKAGVWTATEKYDTTPWTIEIAGLVDQPMRIDVDKLMRDIGLEERVYRFRCVEAWAMTVPWTGFPLASLLKLAQPQSAAKYVRFVSVSRSDQMPGIGNAPWYPWPYHEGLRLDEAMNELAFVVTGVYGHPLTKQMGAPIRIVLPWKYGYKGPKAIERIELVAEQPKTFWNTAVAAEYGFYSNVNPNKPHPRWSQAEERLLPDGEKIQTQLYNGYGTQVASLYKGDEF